MNPRPGRGSAFPARLEPGAAASAARTPVLRPQRLWQEAAADQARSQVPSGVGLDSDRVRQRMVRRLQAQGVDHPAVLAAMACVPRHRFVDSALVTQAYEDTSLPIGLGQTISKPIVVGRMLQLLATRPGAAVERPLGRVLEIGTGCGYQAALLALLARRVVSIERLKPLHDRARAHLDAVGVRDVRLVWGDGRLGHAPLAPYDTILAAAGGDELPQAWLEQLAPGGRMVAPMHSAEHAGQVLVMMERDASGWRRSIHGAVHFVPLAQGTA